MPSLQIRLDHRATEQSLLGSHPNFGCARLLFSIRSRNISVIEETIRKSKLRKLGHLQTPLLSVAIMSNSDPEVIDCLLRHGCQIRDHDSNGYTPMHFAIWSWDNVGNRRNKLSQMQLMGINYDKVHRLDLIDSFLNFMSKNDQSHEIFPCIFLDANKHGLTPFLLACASGCVEIITLFISILDRSEESILEGKLIDNDGRNPLHHILGCSENLNASILMEIIALLLKYLPSSMINSRNKDGLTPLRYWTTHRCWDLKIAKFLLDHGSCPDAFDYEGRSLLHKAVEARNVPFVDLLLRSGCRVNVAQDKSVNRLGSPLSESLHSPIFAFRPLPPSPEIIDLLLAFGADLSQEFYLYIEPGAKKMTENLELEYGMCLQSMRVTPHVQAVKALRDIRRSGVLISLQRICRVAIRQYLGNKADEVIGDLDCIPGTLKAFLLVRSDLKLLNF